MSLRTCILLLCGLALLPVRAELWLAKAWPAKVFCLPGETQTLTIDVANPDPAAATAQLRVELVHDLDATVLLREETVNVPGKNHTVVTLTWKAEPWLGVELRATLLRDGTAFETKSEYFTCAANVHQVLMSFYNPLCLGAVHGANLDALVAQTVTNARDCYANWSEKFGWPPSDYDDLTPDTDTWWAGQVQYNESKPNMLKLFTALADNGIRPVTYGKAGGGGHVTFEFLRRNPELAVYGDGHPAGGDYNTAFLDYIPALGPPKPDDTHPVAQPPAEMEKSGYAGAGWFAPFIEKPCSWSDIWYDGANEAVIRHMSEEMGGSHTMLGFAGVRFDGEFAACRFRRFDGAYNVPANFNADAIDAEMVRKMKAWTWVIAPNYLFAYNTHTDLRWNSNTDSTPLAYREKCRDDGLIVAEEMAFPGGVPWTQYLETLRHHADLARCYGGHYAIIPFDRNPDIPYCHITALALRAHSHFPYPGKLPIGKFATRMAAFLWDRNIHGWSAATEQFSVKGTWNEPVVEDDIDFTEDAPEETPKAPPAVHDLWWKPFAAARPIPGGTQIILHLINAPQAANTPARFPTTTTGVKQYFADMLPALPAADATVRWTKPTGFKRAYLADLDRCDLQPVTPKTEGGALVFTLPEIAHWSMLIIETTMPTPAAEWATSDAKADAKQPSAQDLGLAPNTDDPLHWQVTLYAGDCNWGNGVTDLVTDPDARHKWAVRASPGKKAWYMATGTYFYPKKPGHYTASFRLKVADNTLDEPVVSLSVAHMPAVTFKGAPDYNTKEIVLRGTDFKQPNVYQEFTVPFQHSDNGYHAVSVTYMGKDTVSWDCTDLKLVKPWTTADFEACYDLYTVPANMAIEPHDGVKALYLRGPWNRMYAVDDALKTLGAVEVTNAYITFNFQNGVKTNGYDYTWDGLYQQDVLVAADAEIGALGYGIGKMIRQWVKDGGCLVLLGGMFALGQGGDLQYGWESCLPVTLTPPYEIRKCVPPLAFDLPAKSLAIAGAGAKTPPVVMYRHAVTAKPGASVLLAGAGGEPLFAGIPYGKGRVVVFTGTVLGMPPAGSTAFWTSPVWPGLLGAAIKWGMQRQ